MAGGGLANPDVLQQRPVDVPKAKDAIQKVGEIGARLGKPFRLVDIRKTPVADLLRPGDPDPAKNLKPGLLQESADPKDKWADDPKTREYLENAKAYAESEAKRGLAELTTPEIGLTQDQISKMTLDALKQAVKAKGWIVEATAGDAASQVKAQETIDYLENTHELAKEQAAEVAARALAVGQVDVDNIPSTAELKNLSLDAVDTLLGSIAGGAAEDYLHYRYRQIQKAFGTGEPSGKQKKEMSRLIKLQTELPKLKGQVETKLIQMTESESATPEDRALGYDMQKHMYELQLKQPEQELAKLKAAGQGNGLEAKEIQQQVVEIQKKIGVAQASKDKLVKGGGVDAKGQAIPAHPELAGDLVVQYAQEMAKKLNGTTPLEKKQIDDIADDPLGFIQGQLAEAVKEPEKKQPKGQEKKHNDHMQKMIDAKVVTEDQAKKIEESVKMVEQEKNIIVKERKDQMKQIGTELLGFLALFAYVAYQKKKGAAQG